MSNQYSPHQSRGLKPAVSAPVSQPRCFISGKPIPPGEGAFVVAAEYNTFKGQWIPVVSMYVLKEVLHPYHLWSRHHYGKLVELLAAFDLEVVA